MRKVLSVVGARPNFMKVAPIHRVLRNYENIEHKIVHTGQHYDKNMSDAFFADLDMPQPDYFLGVGSGSHAQQTAKVMVEFEKVLEDYHPDLVLVVGDVNSTVACSITSVKMGIPVAHVEGGLRSNDRTMPEEINRIVTDSISDYCFVTEESAIDNLQMQGFPRQNIFFVGNTMIDSQKYALDKVEKSTILFDLGLKPVEYVLITTHRPSNVDNKEQLEMLLDVFEYTSRFRKLVFPIHPRTRKKIQEFGLQEKVDKIPNFILTDPLGYVDFLNLMMNSDFVMTDSGGIQEETTAISVPCITLRTTTERPVTIEIGTNTLVLPEKDRIIKAIDKVINEPLKKGQVPPLWDGNAAVRIAEIISERIFNL